MFRNLHFSDLITLIETYSTWLDVITQILLCFSYCSPDQTCYIFIQAIVLNANLQSLVIIISGLTGWFHGVSASAGGIWSIHEVFEYYKSIVDKDKTDVLVITPLPTPFVLEPLQLAFSSLSLNSIVLSFNSPYKRSSWNLESSPIFKLNIIFRTCLILLLLARQRCSLRYVAISGYGYLESICSILLCKLLRIRYFIIFSEIPSQLQILVIYLI